MNVVIASLLLHVSLSAWPQDPPRPVDSAADRLDQRLLEAHNKARADAKLPPLTIDPRLTEAARRHAEDMAEHEKMTHEGSDGSSPEDRVKRVQYHYHRTGENVAFGQEDVDQVMEAWMESPGHKANILGEFTQMGAARVVGEDDMPYWCVDFGKPIPRLDPDEAAKGLVARINEARKDAGVEPLKVDEKLAGVASTMAKAAAEAGSAQPRKAAEAEKPKPPDLAALVRKAGLTFSKLNQSMASGDPTPEDVVKSLLKDDGQKEALLGPFGSVGVGYANGADDAPYWCILLVEP